MLTGSAASPHGELFSAPAANNAPVGGGGLCGALRALVDAVHSHSRSGSLKKKKKTFQDFHPVPGCFVPPGAEKSLRHQVNKDEESGVLGCAGRDERPADGAR